MSCILCRLVGQFCLNGLEWLDHGLNWLTLGDADETVSARTARARNHGSKLAAAFCDFLTAATAVVTFGRVKRDHCEWALLKSALPLTREIWDWNTNSIRAQPINIVEPNELYNVSLFGTAEKRKRGSLGATFAPAFGSTIASNLQTAVLVKAAPGQLLGLDITNTSTAVAFIGMFDVATAGSVTLGTTIPKVSFGIAGSASRTVTVGDVWVQFNTGMVMAATTTPTGSTTAAAGVYVTAMFD